MTRTQADHLETLAEIRSLMDRSSRFISLSGLSGVVAGTLALIGVALSYWYLGTTPFSEGQDYYIVARSTHKWGMDHLTFFFSTGLIILVLAVGAGIFLTTKKARQNKQSIWDALTKRLVGNLLIPLVAGGIFCLALYYHGHTGLIAPVTLLFYGLGLVNASKYTLPDVRYLGLAEVALGCIGLFFLNYGLEFWAIGFGLLHITYGLLMYNKYEKHNRGSQ